MTLPHHFRVLFWSCYHVRSALNGPLILLGFIQKWRDIERKRGWVRLFYDYFVAFLKRKNQNQAIKPLNRVES